MLRLKKGIEYKRRRIPLQKGSSKNQKRNHLVTNLKYLYKSENIYKNIPFSSMAKKSFSFQLVHLSHSNTN